MPTVLDLQKFSQFAQQRSVHPDSLLQGSSISVRIIQASLVSLKIFFRLYMTNFLQKNISFYFLNNFHSEDKYYFYYISSSYSRKVFPYLTSPALPSFCYVLGPVFESICHDNLKSPGLPERLDKLRLKNTLCLSEIQWLLMGS